MNHRGSFRRSVIAFVTLVFAAAMLAASSGGGAPSAPTNFTAQVINFFGNYYASVHWTDTSDNETGFIVEHKQGPNRRTVVVPADSTGAIMALFRGTNTYRVRAFNDAGNSAWSNSVRLRW